MKNQSQPATPNIPRAAWFLPLLLFCLLVVPGGGYIIWTGSHIVFPKLGATNTPQTALVGVTVEEKRPAFRLHGWFSGDFQAHFGRWFGQRFVLRPEMVKTDNQIGYTVFHKSNTPNTIVTIGRGKVLYETVYVREYCGLDPPMLPELTEQVASDMADVANRLRARGIGFVVSIAPCKPAIYPKDLPPAYLSYKPSVPRSYDISLAALKRHHVLTVDGHAALIQAKAARPDDILFCQGGTHYSDLGMLYMLRPLLQAIAVAGGKPVPALRWNTPVPVDNRPTERDTDLSRMLNLWNPPIHSLSPHPVAVFDVPREQTNRVRRVAVVGDSFCWQPMDLLGEKRIFEQVDFYYYYHNDHYRYPDKRSVPLGAMADEWKNTFLHSDVIVLEMNETQLRDKGKTHFAAFLQDAKKYLPISVPASKSK